MKADECEERHEKVVNLKLQHGTLTLEFVPKNDKTGSEVREEVHEILTQMYIRSRTRTRSKSREGDLADAA